MPRPSKEWEKKYGKKATPKKTLLSGADDVYSASEKLACGVPETQAIILQMFRQIPTSIDQTIRLLDMDDMGLHGQKIVDAYHKWADNDYDKLIQGLIDRTIKV